MMTKYLKFTLGGFSQGYKTLEIFIKTKKVTYKILRNGFQEVEQKKPFTVEVTDEWLSEFDALDISSWAKDYFNSAVLDGTQWELIFKHGKKSYRGYGSNAYPKNWVRFLDWLDKLIPEMELVNRKQVEKMTLDYSRKSANGPNVSERLTLDHIKNTLTLNKKNSQHIYNISEDAKKIFAAAQKFFDGLAVEKSEPDYPLQIKIELIRHDGSIENFEAPYDDICLPGLTNFIETIKSVVTDLSAEIFVTITDNVQRDKYIFCKVQFKGSYKSYTYRTEDESLAVGDVVDVPVGKNNDVAQAKIVEIGYFDAQDAPFPVDKIKTIIGKHLANDWENY